MIEASKLIPEESLIRGAIVSEGGSNAVIFDVVSFG
jgi:hypothetical protein